MGNNKITVKQILDMATKYQFSDWRLEGARTGKSICQSNYRSSVVNEYYEKIVASISTEIFIQNIVNHAASRLVISVLGE